MNRENKTLQTPEGKQLVLKSFLNAGERNVLRSVYLSAMKVDGNAGAVSVDSIPGTVVEEAEKKLLELAVVSYDGNTENILGRLLEATPDEYDFVVAEAGKVNSGGLKPAK